MRTQFTAILSSLMDVLMITQGVNAVRDGSIEQEKLKAFAGLTNRLVVIVINKGRTLSTRKVSDSLWIIPTNTFFLWLAPFVALGIARRELFFQGRLQADVIAAQDPGLSGATGWLIAKYFHRSFHLYIKRNVFSPTFTRRSLAHAAREFLARLLAKQATKLCVGSEAVHTALADIDVALSDDATVIPYSIDVEAFQDEPLRADLHAKYPKFKIILLMVGPLVDQQNMQLGIRILAALRSTYSHIGLVIVGEGKLKGSLETLARSLGVSEWVVIEKWNQNLSSYYKTAHIFMVTALYEEYGDTLSEAAAASCALVSSDVGFASTLITEGESGFICDPTDIATYIKALVPLILKPGLRDRVRVNAMLSIKHYAQNTESKKHFMELYKQSWESAMATGVGSEA